MTMIGGRALTWLWTAHCSAQLPLAAHRTRPLPRAPACSTCGARQGLVSVAHCTTVELLSVATDRATTSALTRHTPRLTWWLGACTGRDESSHRLHATKHIATHTNEHARSVMICCSCGRGWHWCAACSNVGVVSGGVQFERRSSR
jgi:hypothetical protein